jgi:hypothetical protein
MRIAAIKVWDGCGNTMFDGFHCLQPNLEGVGAKAGEVIRV